MTDTLDHIPANAGVTQQRIQSPEQLNRAIHLTSRSTWIILIVLAVCMFMVLMWSTLGRISFYVQGMGVTMALRGAVLDVVTPSGGLVQDIRVKVGQRIARDDVMFVIRQDELAARRKAAADTLAQLQSALATYRTESSQDVTRRRTELIQQIQTVQENLEDSRNEEKQLATIYAARQQELANGLTTRPQVEATFSQLIGVQEKIRELQERPPTLQIQQIEFENQVNYTTSELEMKVTDAKGQLDDLDAQISFGGTIRSPATGYVTEVSAQPNSTVPSGNQLGVVATGDNRLTVSAYLPVGAGKRVAEGMPVEISPTSVDRNIYGSIRGIVTNVSALPVSRETLISLLGNNALANEMMAQGAPIQAEVRLEADDATVSGLRWTSSMGPPVQITPGTVANITVLVRSERPILLVFPLASTWLGL